MINDIAEVRGTISDVVCVGSPVIIIIYKRKFNKQVCRKFGIFNWSRDHNTSIKSTKRSKCSYTYPLHLQLLTPLNSFVLSKYILLRKAFIWKSNALVWFPYIKKMTMWLNIKGEANHRHRLQKKHILPMSLLLWCELVAVCCSFCL